MDLAEGLLLALIILPAMGGAVAGASRGKLLTWVIVITALATAVVSIWLFIIVEREHLLTVSVASSDLFGLSFLIPLLDVALGLFFIYMGYRRKRWSIVAMAAITLLVPFYLVLQTKGEIADPVLYLDHLSLTMLLITSLIGAVICIYAVKYMERDAGRPRFFLFMLLFLGAMNAAVLSNDMLWLFFFWEVTTLCSFMLIGHERTSEAGEAADRALLYTLGGGVAFSFSLLFLFEETGSLDLSGLPSGTGLSTIVLLSLGLLVVASLTKSAQVPFQRWLVGAMVAPTPVSALLHSATMVNLGVYLLLRLHPQFMAAPLMGDGLALVGGFSFLVSSVLALRQSNAKRVLAYSTVANLALIVACVGIGTPLAIAAGMVLLIFHAVSKALLFLTVGVVKHETGSEDIESMIELRQRMPFIALALYSGVFLMLLPAFGLFAGKWMVSETATEFLPFLFLFALGLGATVAYYAKWLGRAMSSGPRDRDREVRWNDPSPWFTLPLLTLMISAFVLSLGISFVFSEIVAPYVNTFHDIPVEGDLFSLHTAFGTLPSFALFLTVVLAIILLFFTIKPSKAELSQAYTCGEGGDFRVVGSYWYGESREKVLLVFSDVIGLALVLAIFALALFPEVVF